MMPDPTLAAETIARLAREAPVVQTAPGGLPFVVVPAGSQIHSLENLIYHSHLDAPSRMKGTVTVADVASFLLYWNKFADADSLVFADEEESQIVAILDYHHAGAAGGARWREHRLKLVLEPSKEWL